MPVTGTGAAVSGLGGPAGYGEIVLPRSDDGTLRIDTSVVFQGPLNYFGSSFAATDLWVNTNGTVSLGMAWPAYPTGANSGARGDVIGIFWADVDTRLRGEGIESGQIYVDIDPVADCVSITWDMVGVYRRDTASPNRFQLQLYDRGGGDFDIVFRYERVDWSIGTAADDAGARIMMDGLRLVSPYLPTPGIVPAQLDTAVGNSGIRALWVFEMRAGTLSGASVAAGSVLTGGAGADVLTGSAYGDSLSGLGGNDELTGLRGDDTLLGGAGLDTLAGGEGADSLDGGDGNDLMTGGNGSDAMSGGDGDDSMDGGANADVMWGGAGNDSLRGGDGADRLEGGIGNDLLRGSAGNDLLLGEDGNDTLYGGDGTDTLNGGAGDDVIYGGINEIDLRDVIYGGDGNDTLYGGGGNDEMNGGNGNDVMSGDLGADTLIGNAGADTISGGGGGDLIYGNDGDDFINGGFGYDRINGGAGADSFYHLGVYDHGSDWIQDYTAAQGDVLVFGQPGATADQFQVNYAHTANAEGIRSGSAGVAEAFVIYRPTGQIIWALVDGAGQSSIDILLDGQIFDLLA